MERAVAPAPANHDVFDSRFDVIAIGASAGGFHALEAILNPFPPDFPPSILIVQHLDPHRPSYLVDLLANRTRLVVKQAEHGERILPATVYIAPPDQHLLVGPGRIQLAHTQLVHYSRPSIDLLFESVAGMYGSRSIAVVLSGSNRDGSAGLRAVKESGGTTMVQNPQTADFKVMPQFAVATGCADYVLGVDELGPALVKLCTSAKVQP